MSIGELADLLPAQEKQDMLWEFVSRGLGVVMEADALFGGAVAALGKERIGDVWQKLGGTVQTQVSDHRTARKVVQSWTWQQLCLAAAVLSRDMLGHVARLAAKHHADDNIGNAGWAALGDDEQHALRIMAMAGCVPDRIPARSAGEDFAMWPVDALGYDLVSKVLASVTWVEIVGIVVAYGHFNAAGNLRLLGDMGLLDLDKRYVDRPMAIEFKCREAIYRAIGI